jgi:hypothetical protein
MAWMQQRRLLLDTLLPGAARVPVATLRMVSERTGDYQMLVAAALSVMLSYFVQASVTRRKRYRSLYDAQVATRADSPAHQAEHLNTAFTLLRRRLDFPETSSDSSCCVVGADAQLPQEPTSSCTSGSVSAAVVAAAQWPPRSGPLNISRGSGPRRKRASNKGRYAPVPTSVYPRREAGLDSPSSRVACRRTDGNFRRRMLQPEPPLPCSPCAAPGNGEFGSGPRGLHL